MSFGVGFCGLKKPLDLEEGVAFLVTKCNLQQPRCLKNSMHDKNGFRNLGWQKISQHVLILPIAKEGT